MWNHAGDSKVHQLFRVFYFMVKASVHDIVQSVLSYLSRNIQKRLRVRTPRAPLAIKWKVARRKKMFEIVLLLISSVTVDVNALWNLHFILIMFVPSFYLRTCDTSTFEIIRFGSQKHRIKIQLNIKSRCNIDNHHQVSELIGLWLPGSATVRKRRKIWPNTILVS